MALFIDHLVLFLSTFLTLIAVKGTSKSFSCDEHFYFDSLRGGCKKCSSCPTNHIIDSPCSRFADVRCRSYIFKHYRRIDSNFKNSSSSEKSRNHIKKTRIEKGKKSSPINNGGLATVDNEDKYWKTLAFALIGLLSVLIIATFIILIFVYKKLQKSIVIKQSEEGDLIDDADSDYVVIRAIHHLATPRPDHPILSLYTREPTETHPPLLMSSDPTSVDSGRPAESLSTSTQLPTEGKLCFFPKVYQPQRRLLNYDADDVFESDDNASVNHLAGQKQKLQALLDENNT